MQAKEAQPAQFYERIQANPLVDSFYLESLGPWNHGLWWSSFGFNSKKVRFSFAWQKRIQLTDWYFGPGQALEETMHSLMISEESSRALKFFRAKNEWIIFVDMTHSLTFPKAIFHYVNAPLCALCQTKSHKENSRQRSTLIQDLRFEDTLYKGDKEKIDVMKDYHGSDPIK